MFSGLSVKSVDDGRSKGGAAMNDAPTSGFSFLPANNTEGRSIPSPVHEGGEDNNITSDAPSPSASGFSFLSAPSISSSNFQPQMQEASLDPSVALIPSTSGFSFLSTSTTPSNQDMPPEPTPSAFSFLNSTIGTNTAPSSQQQHPIVYDVQEDSVVTTTAPSSAFSFLSQPTYSVTIAPPDLTITSAPPPFVPSSYSKLAVTNPIMNSTTNNSSDNNYHQPSAIAAGVVFQGAASTPKPGGIQKKRRGKKVGIGAAQDQQDVMTSSEPIPTNSSTYPQRNETTAATNVHTAADMAVERAEQFMLQKQRENSAGIHPSSELAVGRYGANNQDTVDATVEAAERAAKEAQQFMANGGGNNSGGGNGNKTGIMSGFFGRKKFGFLGNASVHGKQQADVVVLHNTGGPPSRSNSTDSNTMNNHQNDPDVVATAATPTRNTPISFVIPTINNRAPDSDNIPRDDTLTGDPATMQRRFEEERRAQFKEQERIWQATQQEREERERQAREKEEERMRILAEEERKKNRSPHEKIDELLGEFSLDAQQAMKRVSDLRKQKALIEEEKNSTEKKLRILTQQQSLTERQQTAAAEAEDFYLADRFAAVLEKLSNDCQEQELTLAGIQNALSHLEGQQNELVERVVECFRRIKRSLKLVHDEQEGKRKEGGNEEQLKFVTTTKKISSETERLAIEREHLERDEEVVIKERQELEESIHVETSEEESLRVAAISVLENVNAEIEALKLKLAEKEAEAVNLCVSIAGYDSSILKVRSKFNRQLGRVSKKDLALKENRNEWEADTKALNLLKEGHEKEVQLHSEKLMKHEQLMEMIKEELSSAVTMETMISDELNALNDVVLVENPTEFWEQQADVAECQVAVDEAREELRTALEDLEELREEWSKLERRIPLLEQQKNTAVSARDFKAAGRASKDIKDAIARKEQCEQEINGEGTHRITRMTKTLEKFASDLNAKKEMVYQIEHEQAQISMAKLANKISELEQIKERVGNEKSGVASVGGAVLNEEINALMKEGEAIGEKYGGWADFISILNMNDERGTLSTVMSDQSEDNETEAFKSPVITELSGTDTVIGDGKDVLASKLEKTKEIFERWQTLTAKIKILEESLENAIAEEDYEAAANIDDELQLVKSEIRNMNFTEDDIEAVMRCINIQAEDGSNSNVENIPTTELPAINNYLSKEEVEVTSNGEVDSHHDVAVQSKNTDNESYSDDEEDTEEVGCLI